MAFLTVSTDRLTVRPFTTDLFEQWSDMRTSIGHNQYLKAYRRRADADRLQQEFGQRLANREFGAEPLYLAITNEDTLVGELILYPARNWTVYLSWIARPGFERKGFMVEAVAGAVDTLFKVATHRVVAAISPANDRSRNLAQKVGFRHESTALQVEQIGVRWSDLEYWALLPEDRIHA